MRPTSLLLGLLLVGLFAGPSADAVGPLQDDADSGSDAGDVRSMATEISPGMYTTSLQIGVDTEDHFTFFAVRGSAILIDIEAPRDFAGEIWLNGPEGPDNILPDTHQFRDAATRSNTYDLRWIFDGEGARMRTPALYTGEWYLSIIMADVSTTPTAEIAFTLRAVEDGAIVATTTDGWQTLEASWDEHQDVWLYSRVESNHVVDRPGAIMQTREYDLTYRRSLDGTVQNVTLQGTGWSRMGGGSIQRSWSLPGELVPDGTLPSTSVHGSGGWIMSYGSFPASEGSLRMTGFGVGGNHRSLMGLVHGDVMASASASGGEVADWTDADNDGDIVKTPGFTFKGPRTLEIDVADRVVGFLDPQGAHSNLTGPNGTRYDPHPFFGKYTLVHDVPGSWRFAVGQSAGYGHDSDRLFAALAFPESLGLFTSQDFNRLPGPA